MERIQVIICSRDRKENVRDKRGLYSCLVTSACLGMSRIGRGSKRMSQKETVTCARIVNEKGGTAERARAQMAGGRQWKQTGQRGRGGGAG